MIYYGKRQKQEINDIKIDLKDHPADSYTMYEWNIKSTYKGTCVVMKSNII